MQIIMLIYLFVLFFIISFNVKLIAPILNLFLAQYEPKKLKVLNYNCIITKLYSNFKDFNMVSLIKMFTTPNNILELLNI